MLSIDGRHSPAWALTVVLGASLAFASCDDEVSGPSDGDGFGTVAAVVVDDPQNAVPTVLGESGDIARSTSGVSSLFTGSVQGDFQASISIDGETWVDLGSPSAVSVALQSTGNETSVHGQASVPVGTYTRVRLVIDGADAQLTAGSVVGTITLGVDTSVSIGADGQAVVDLAIAPFTIEDDTDARILFDLNSEVWLTESAVTVGTAAEADVAAAVDVGVSMSPS